MDEKKKIVHRYEELMASMGDPDVISNNEQYLKIVKEHASLTPIVEAIQTLDKLKEDLKSAQALYAETPVGEEDMRQMVREEMASLEESIVNQEETLRILLLPKDPRDDKDIFLEIRSGAGGSEAALFGMDLYQMYMGYCARMGYKTELIDLSETDIGGVKELVCQISGQGAYTHFKFETGVHRVQRVPVTESGGRIHTSTVTVAVMPEVDDVAIDINPNDLLIDTYRASGAGGQHVNKTESAIRITHKPSGVVVTCQDQRSQIKNREKAMAILKARLFEMEEEKQRSALASERKEQVGTGDRSERIRTYNFPQGRVTDHRIGLTLYKLDAVMLGEIEDIVEGLIEADRSNTLGKNTGNLED